MKQKFRCFMESKVVSGVLDYIDGLVPSWSSV